ncbi:MAG: hypothetical protein IKS90_07310 [Clostridia bacterium]|nr:hypothetical protein [Clostridia bacterium]
MYIIGNGTLFTGGSTPLVSENAVLVDGTKIAAIAPVSELKRSFPDAEFIDAEGGLIMPSLIDLSVKSRRTLFRTLPEGAMPACEVHIRFSRCTAKEDNSLDPELIVSGTYLAALKMIKSGITTVLDNHLSPKCVSGSLSSLASVYRECGLRVCLCYAASCDDGIAENSEFGAYCASLDSPLLHGIYALARFVDNTTVINTVTASNGGKLFIDLPKSSFGGYDTLRKYGMRPVELLDSLGALGSGTVLAGGFDLTEQDIALINKRGAAYVLTPVLGLLIGHRNANFSLLDKRLDRIGIGTDSLIGDQFEMLRDIVIAERISGREFTTDACINALIHGNASIASSLFGTTLGVIEVGGEADIAIFDHCFCPSLDAVSIKRLMLSSLNAASCTFTMCAGRVLMHKGDFPAINKAAVIKRAEHATDALIKKMR